MIMWKCPWVKWHKINQICALHFSAKSLYLCTVFIHFSPRKAKTLWSFGRFECKSVRMVTAQICFFISGLHIVRAERNTQKISSKFGIKLWWRWVSVLALVLLIFVAYVQGESNTYSLKISGLVSSNVNFCHVFVFTINFWKFGRVK